MVWFRFQYHNVIIDCQNYNIKSRKNYITICKNTNIIAIIINTTNQEFHFLNKFRVEQGKGLHKNIPTIVLNIFNKK